MGEENAVVFELLEMAKIKAMEIKKVHGDLFLDNIITSLYFHFKILCQENEELKKQLNSKVAGGD